METYPTWDLVDNNDDLLKKLTTSDRIVALFYASWCPYCTKFLPIFRKHMGKEGLLFVIVQDDDETIADHYSVEIYPTVLMFEKGIIAKRLDGVKKVGLNERQLEEFLEG